MKRELAFALEARSQFGCFTGRTRSSETSPVAQLFTRSPVKVIDEVHVNRRNKRVKTDIPDGDLVNIEKSEGKEESEPVAVEEAVNGEEKSTAEDVVTAVTGGEESVVEVGEGLVEKVNVKRKKGKKEVRGDTPRRFTRSALKEKDENVEELATSSQKKLELKKKDENENVVELGTSSRKKLELKMSKKIGLDRMPTNMRELLETGLLEGFRVYYKLGNEGKNLQGVIKGAGVLCSCESCESKQVIAPSQFEMHARKSYRHAIKHIYLENGKNLLELIEICKASASEPLEVALQTVISSLPAKEPSICTKCNSEQYSNQYNLLCFFSYYFFNHDILSHALQAHLYHLLPKIC
ncbi:putative Jas TPL-binding domain-containing protein [Helianthus annuus]|nr:putative Jas TPL-binding domain-containing protein [Helianthus annuus]